MQSAAGGRNTSIWNAVLILVDRPFRISSIRIAGSYTRSTSGHVSSQTSEASNTNIQAIRRSACSRYLPKYGPASCLAKLHEASLVMSGLQNIETFLRYNSVAFDYYVLPNIVYLLTTSDARAVLRPVEEKLRLQFFCCRQKAADENSLRGRSPAPRPPSTSLPITAHGEFQVVQPHRAQH
jgi:hypothetical protein